MFAIHCICNMQTTGVKRKKKRHLNLFTLHYAYTILWHRFNNILNIIFFLNEIKILHLKLKPPAVLGKVTFKSNALQYCVTP